MISALENHIWQSTLFTALAALFALVFRRNRAQVRHWIWLSASMKFLVPFSVLVSMGGHLGWRTETTQPMNIEQFVLPFAPAAASSVLMATVPPAVNRTSVLPFTIWACGFIAVLFYWWRRGQRVRAALRTATPLHLELGIEAMSCSALLEPGVFGILRPLLLLPKGITDRLTPAQLSAVLAHELCHVRRRDNLAAAIHMVVEAIFWFHPLVWWIGARLVDERERACDEEVLRLGSQPQDYAAGILKVCEFYLESPLTCVSGVTGSNLKQRIEVILMNRRALNLDTTKRLLLAVAGIAAIAGPIAIGILNAPAIRAQEPQTRPTFEATSVKPNKSADRKFGIVPSPGGRLRATNTSLKQLINVAYQLPDFRITGDSGWISSDRFDIEAKAAGDPPRAQMQLMLQSLLAERFKLVVHRETKELPTYELRVAKNGPKLKEGKCVGQPGPLNPCGGFTASIWGHMLAKAADMKQLAQFLSSQESRVVVDKTGLTGDYDMELTWTPDQMPTGPGDPDQAPPDPNGPSIFTALQEQLGLHLEPAKGPVEILVIDSAEKPSEN